MQRIADEGERIKVKALTFAALLVDDYGADPTRLHEQDAYRDDPIVTVPAIVMDYMVALLMHVAPTRPGPKTSQSTRDALRLQRVLRTSQRMAAKIVADTINEDAGRKEEDAEAIRQRLVARKRARSGKARSGEAPSPTPRKPPSRRPR